MDRRGSSSTKPFIEDENEYDWSAEANDYDAELNSYIKKDLPKAISASTREFSRRNNSADGYVEDERKGKARGDSLLQESAFETLTRLSNQFPAIVEDGADTLVWIGEPPQQRGQDDYEYGYIRRQFQMPYLMKSTTLRRLNSPKFDKFLGPMSARTERRLKKHAVHKLVQSTENIKYYVDLSPVLNDEEAMAQLSQLTVPHGALAWHQTARQFAIDTELVCGRDDLDIPPRPIYTYKHDSQTVHETDIENLEKKLDSIADELKAGEQKLSEEKQKLAANPPRKDLYNLPLEEEYTQLRHHTAIARLLHAITGSDPKLNSAAKAWTFCMLANYFECASSSTVSHWVISWLLQNNNINFIQTLPELSYRIGMVTQSGWLVRSSFAILVGSRAMAKGIKDCVGVNYIDWKQSDRSMECLDDDEINRIDHAAEAFSRRLKATLDEIVVFPGIWTFSDVKHADLWRLRELEASTDHDQEHLARVTDNLKNYVRRVMYMTMSDAYPFDNKSVAPFKASPMFTAYSQVPRSLRFLTRFHWEVMGHEELYRDYLDTPNNHKIWRNTCEMLEHDGLLLDTNIPYISKQVLYDAIKSLNDVLFSTQNYDLDKSPKSGGKRSDPDQWLAAPQPSSSSKRTKTAQPEQLEQPVSQTIDLPIRSQAIDRTSDREIVAESSSKRKFADEEGSDTIPDDWEEIFESDAGQKAVRFLPVRQKPARESDSLLSDHESAEERPTTSTGIASKFQEMEIGSDNLSSGQNEVNSDQADHIRGSSSASLYVHRGTSPINYPSMQQPAPNDIYEPKPFVMNPKPHFDSPAGPAYKDWSDTRAIVPEGLLRDLSKVLSKRLKSLLVPGYVADGSLDFDIPVDNINTLLCLGEDEYKYLPLWAGGFDDGSGGVFDDGAEVPDAPDVADGGFRGGAMGIIPGVGSSIGGSMAGSEFEDIRTEVGVSTVGKASRYATDGTATETVMSLDE